MADIKQMIDKRLNDIESNNQEDTSVLPNASEVETRISGREDLLTNMREDVISTFKEGDFLDRFMKITQPGQDLAKGLGGLFQRGEAGLANVGLEAQRGEGDILEEFTKGVSGERLGEAGDLIRTTGVGDDVKIPVVSQVTGQDANELMASSSGLISMAALSNLGSGGRIASGARKMRNAVMKTAKQTGKRSLKKGRFLKEQADMMNQGIDDAFTGIRGEFDEVYKKIGNNPLTGDDFVDLNDISVRLVKGDPTTFNRLKRLGELTADDLVNPRTGSVIKPNVRTAKIIKDEVNRRIPKKVWKKVEPPTADQAQLIEDYFKMNDLLAKNAGSQRQTLLELNKRFTELNRTADKIRPLFRSSKGVTRVRPLKNIKDPENISNLDEVVKFNEDFFRDGEKVLREIDKFNRAQKLEKGIKWATGGAVGLSLLDRFVSRPIRSSLDELNSGGIGRDSR